MRILLLHNYYQQLGGEDVVLEQEQMLLRSKGHDVRVVTATNESIKGLYSKVRTAAESTYSRRSRIRIHDEIVTFHPDVVHVHNFFPLLSPSVYYACRAAKVPVVQTLHNLRFVCPNGLLFRDGARCELCLGKTVAWPAVRHACYRDSHLGSAAVVSMLAAHRYLGTWSTKVHAYIALTKFSRQKLIAGGLPADRLFVKPNFVVPDPGRGCQRDDFALFVGRLSEEKGVRTLLSAWERLGRARKIKIVGEGSLRAAVLGSVKANPSIEFLGPRTAKAVLDLMGIARLLVVPSRCYEGFPRVIVEAFSKGLPVVGSRLGSIEELIDHGRTGMLFEPDNPQDLADTVEWMFTHPDDLWRMSDAARSEFEAKYTSDRNYEQLMDIYHRAQTISQLHKS